MQENSENRLEVVVEILNKMQNSKDIISREINVASRRVDFVFLQDLTSYAVISEYIIKPLQKINELPKTENALINYLVKDVICGGDIISAYGDHNRIVRDCEIYKESYGFAKPYYVRGNQIRYIKTLF